MVTYSIESYCLAKQVYIDKLERVGTTGDTITGDHIRLKPVPTYCVQYTSNSMSMQPLDMYNQL